MWNWVANLVNLCTPTEVADESLWSRAIADHTFGKFSIAVTQAHAELQDQSQVLSGNNVTFIAVFDGHGCPEASAYHCDNTFPNLTGRLQGVQDMLPNDPQAAFLTTRDTFIAETQNPAATGSCCLIGVFWKGALHIVSKGHSCAVLGTLESYDVLGSLERKRIKEHLLNGYYSLDPQTISRPIIPANKFVIFGSDGLWEDMSYEDAVKIVNRNSKEGIAKRLVETAVRKAAKRHGVNPNVVKSCPRGERTKYHDDITAIVVFLNHDLMHDRYLKPPVSVRCYVDDVEADINDFVAFAHLGQAQAADADFDDDDVALQGADAAQGEDLAAQGSPQNADIASQGADAAPPDAGAAP